MPSRAESSPLRGQLQALDQRVAQRRAINARYLQLLADAPGVTFMPEAPYGECTLWLTCLQIDREQFGADREQIRAHLETLDIEARSVWKPMHQQPMFSGCRVRAGAVADRLFERALCLPSGSALTPGEQERVVAAIRDVSRA